MGWVGSTTVIILAMNTPIYHIVLFYNYRQSSSPPITQHAIEQHKSFCQQLGLTGRVLLANEGINGSVSSTDRSKLDLYTNSLINNPLYTLVESDFKRSIGTSEPFRDMFIKPVKEIINSGGVISVPVSNQAGTHLTPQEFHAKLTAAKQTTIVLDIRNHAEYMVGHFEGAVDPNCRTFAEFPKYLAEQAHGLKDKTVLMYCTGGIRCEKASYYLKQLGVNDVYQLKGGVHKYLEQYPQGGAWNGKNFVFDKRCYQPTPSMPKEKTVVGQCFACQIPFDELTGATVCTVCRDYVLVCHTCRPKLKYQYHCNNHKHLQTCYFSDLSVFREEELLEQKQCLLNLLSAMKAVKKSDLKKGKRKRKTLRKQIIKIEKVLLMDGGGGGGGGSMDGTSTKCTERPVLHAVAKCRTCGKCECNGECWGFWKT